MIFLKNAWNNNNGFQKQRTLADVHINKATVLNFRVFKIRCALIGKNKKKNAT